MTRLTRRLITSLIALSALALGAWPMAALAGPFGRPPLGTAANFAVLAGSTVTNTGPTTITGQVGLSPGTEVTGFPPGTSGAQHIADPTAVTAQNDLTTAYLDAAGQTPCTTLTGDLGGKSLPAGLYCYSSDALLTGTLTLGGSGPWVFQIGSKLTTASNSTVSVIDATQACDVFWQVGSSATLGTSTNFVGNIMALTSIALQTGAKIVPGRALAQTGAVTLDTNTITAPTSCNAPAATASPSASATASPGASPTASPSALLTASPSALPVLTASPSARPTPRPVPRLASTGAGPQEGFPWMVVLIAGGLGAVGLGLSVRARRRRV